MALMFARYCKYPFIHLVKFTHAKLPGPVYYCDNNQDVTSTIDGGVSQIFTSTPMNVSIPIEDTQSLPSGSIAMDNTQLDMSALVILTMGPNDPPICTIWIVNMNEPNTVVAGPYPMEMRQPQVNEQQMTCSLQYEEAGDEQVPGDMMGPGTTPGIFTASWYQQIDD